MQTIYGESSRTIVKCECKASEDIRAEMVEVAKGLNLAAVSRIDQLQAKLREMCQWCPQRPIIRSRRV